MKGKSRIKRALILIIGVLVAMCMSGMTAFADDASESSGNALAPASIVTAKGEGDIILDGYCGPDEDQQSIYWNLNYDTGYLKLSGSGDMGFSPWYNNQYWRTLPKDVRIQCEITSLCDNAFCDCVNLEYVGFYGVDGKRKLKKIGKRAFANCTSLNNGVINNIFAWPLEEIGEEAFSNCGGLTQLSMLYCVKKIDRYAFSGCTNLRTVEIGTVLEEIGANAFAGCTSLSGINVDGGNQHFSSDNGVLLNKDKTTLIACPAAKGDYTIPDTVTRIDQYAFSGCKNLKSLTIPASVTSIGQFAFDGCSSLETITFLGSAPEFHPFAFGGLTATVVFPGGDASWTDEVLEGYSGTITWKPNPVNLNKCDVIIAPNSYYTGKPIEPLVVVRYNGRVLKKDADYTVSYKGERVNVGIETLTITGNYRYSGIRTGTFYILPAEVTVPSGQALTYNGTVQQGIADSECYTATGATAVDAGAYTATLSVNKNYVWSDGMTTDKEVAWTIKPAVLKIPSGKTLTYTGKKQTGVGRRHGLQYQRQCGNECRDVHCQAQIAKQDEL